MVRAGLATAVLAIASCGRYGFSDQVLVCGQSARFQVGAAGLTAISATEIPSGFAIFTAGPAGAIAGWTYEFTQGSLLAGAQNVPVATSQTGAIGVAANLDQVLLVAAYGMPATGTLTYPLPDTLAAHGTGTQRAGQLATTVPIAVSGDGFAFATQSATNEIDARFVTTTGIDTTAPVKVVDAVQRASDVSLIATATGFAVSYSAHGVNPNASRIELLDANLAVVAPPVTTNNTAYGAFHVRSAWASGSNTYMVVWTEKDVTGDDDVWFQILDANLAPVTPPTVIARKSGSPAIVADNAGFWLAWKNYSTMPSFIDAAYVAPDGTIVPHPLSNSGGAPAVWAIVERLGQPVLVWGETGGTGPDLHFDALCAP